MRVVARRYHFNLGGVMYTFTTMLLMMGAINSQNNLLFGAFGLAIAGLLISGVISGSAMMGLQVTRLPVGRGTVGEPLTIRYRIANRNRLTPAMGLVIEELPPSETLFRRALHGRDAASEASSWERLMPRPMALGVGVGPRRAIEARARVVPRRRGECRLNRVRVRSSFPFGLIGKSVVFAAEQAVVVRPRTVPLAPRFIEQVLSGAMGASGVANPRSAGFDDEFVGLRPYASGDATSRIAWRPSARSLAAGGSLVVRRTAATASSRLWLVLDLPADGATAPGGGPAAGVDPRELAIALAASVIAEMGARGGHAKNAWIGLSVPALGVTAPPRPRKLYADFLLDDLSRLDLRAIDPARRAGLPQRVGAGADAVLVLHAGPAWDLGGPRATHVDPSGLGAVLAGPVPPLVLDGPEPGAADAAGAGGRQP
jgi:uncharacterized protein (DUF58 family)